MSNINEEKDFTVNYASVKNFSFFLVLEKLKQHPEELQFALNKIEVEHRSLLVAGWSSFICWICGLGLANIFIINS